MILESGQNPSYDRDDLRIKKFAENARYLEESATHTEKVTDVVDEQTKKAFLQRNIDVGLLEKEILAADISRLIQVANEGSDLSVSAQLTLVEVAKKNPEKFSEEFIHLLDFEDPKKFDQTADFLDEYRYIQSSLRWHEEEFNSDFWGPDILRATDPQRHARITAGSDKLRSFLQRVVKGQKGNYILNIYARDLLTQMEPQKPEGLESILNQHNDRGSEYEAEEKHDPEKDLIVDDIILPNERTRLSEADAQHYLSDYRFLMSESVRPTLEQDFGAPFLDLNPRERFYFLRFLRENHMRSAASLQEFSKKFGLNGLRTFLVTAQDAHVRDRIFLLAKKMDQSTVERLFAAYAKYIEGIDKVSDYLREQFGEQSTDAVNEITELRLRRAREVLFLSSGYYSPAQNDEFSRFVNFVEEYAEKNLFLNTCKLLNNKGLLSLKDIRDTSLESFTGDKNDPRDAEAILSIQQSRYEKNILRNFRPSYTRNLKVPSRAPIQDFISTGRITRYSHTFDLISCIRATIQRRNTWRHL